MREIFLCKYGEIALKGANRASFEALLVRELKFRLGHVGKFNIIRSQSVIRVEPTEEMTSEQLDTAYTLLRRTFGIVAVSRVAETEKDFDAIAALAVEYLGERLANARTFKVETKRADKRFPMTSDAVSRELGGKILSKFNHLKVDVHNPQVDKGVFKKLNNVEFFNSVKIAFGTISWGDIDICADALYESSVEIKE